MKKLLKEFKINSMTYRQLNRTKKVYMYAVYGKYGKRLICYLVGQITILKNKESIFSDDPQSNKGSRFKDWQYNMAVQYYEWLSGFAECEPSKISEYPRFNFSPPPPGTLVKNHELQNTFKKNGMIYRIISQIGSMALFSITLRSRNTDTIVGYEVAKIHNRPATYIDDKFINEHKGISVNSEFSRDHCKSFFPKDKKEAKRYLIEYDSLFLDQINT